MKHDIVNMLTLPEPITQSLYYSYVNNRDRVISSGSVRMLTISLLIFHHHPISLSFYTIPIMLPLILAGFLLLVFFKT